jgi:hypothetical protein
MPTGLGGLALSLFILLLQSFANILQTRFGAWVVLGLCRALLQLAHVNDVSKAFGCGLAPFGTLRKCFTQQNAATATPAFGFVGEKLYQPTAIRTGHDNAIQIP